MTAFERALKLTFGYEGGFANDPDDPGGRTMMGVTEAVYHDWLRSHAKPLTDVADITIQEASDLYRERYWDDGGCDRLPDMLAVTHFDACVNHGVRQAIKLLQRAVGTADDGQVGPNTIGAANSVDEDRAVREYIRKRTDFYVWLWMNRPNMRKFMGGWISRVRHLEDAVLTREEWR